MNCAKCESQVSIADRNCPKCGYDLLKFEAASSNPGYNGLGREMKNMVLDQYRDNVQKYFAELDSEERKIFRRIEDRMRSLFTRTIVEFEETFESEIVPAIDDLSKTREAEAVFKTIEENIKSNMGEEIYHHYSEKA